MRHRLISQYSIAIHTLRGLPNLSIVSKFVKLIDYIAIVFNKVNIVI